MPGRDPCREIIALLSTMQRLRAPGGCPWDAEQTPGSLAPYLLEEACEVIDALETGSPAQIVDELGDLLLQIVFLAEIFSGSGHFDFADVAATINAKLIRRHPHVFAGESGGHPVADMKSLGLQWERIKRTEAAAPPSHPLGQFPATLPALQRAQKMLARAERAGIAVGPEPPGWVERIRTADELGGLLLVLCGRAQHLGCDAEQALRRAVRQALAETGGIGTPGATNPP